MIVTDQGKQESKEFAQKFVNNRPDICEEHAPDGLPIDEDVSTAHYEKFMEDVVEPELKRNGYEIENVPIESITLVYWELRSYFVKVYKQDASEIQCSQCYNERKENENSVPIKMDVPEEYKDIDQ